MFPQGLPESMQLSYVYFCRALPFLKKFLDEFTFEPSGKILGFAAVDNDNRLVRYNAEEVARVSLSRHMNIYSTAVGKAIHPTNSNVLFDLLLDNNLPKNNFGSHTWTEAFKHAGLDPDLLSKKVSDLA